MININPSTKEINELLQKHSIHEHIVEVRQLSGTTAGRVFRLLASSGERYILKWDDPEDIRVTCQFLNTYSEVMLLPKVLFTSSDNTYFAYSFMEGVTHNHRGAKKEWLTRLVKELLNTYVRLPDTKLWGRMGYPRETWRGFNQISIDEARENLGDVLTAEDYDLVQSTVNRLFEKEETARFLLHGDTGVHNIVFEQKELVGVIDPSPMVGPVIYDFLYAFCSSPDDLDPTLLWDVFGHLEQVTMDKFRLMEEALVHLYCRIGLSNKHHPQDLPEYLEAWDLWKWHIT
ncbi:Phosphotransferase enzyme family protein [Paenibacillus polysaccharolyticus]|uniref:Phosphotransferase enzyme family protein n=1 Tax=Paenibacillus polysaccharolyticus TaxID=582692 RepID=A0A1G5JKF8_9BACL|nr:phosphotransferase [Paenibacillus polysaccharolyticus]SCY88411.1 Phosphotransferase enzyme family protein [Paenibacillus polysaccharolyticus]